MSELIKDPESTSEQRTERLDLRATATERKEIVGRAKLSGVSVSDYLRTAALQATIKPPRPPEERKALVGVANNLNQLVRLANSGHDVREWGPRLHVLLAQLDRYFS